MLTARGVERYGDRFSMCCRNEPVTRAHSVVQRYPDSFTRTIPIWCAVVNVIVREHLDAAGASCGSPDAASGADSPTTDGIPGLHLPSWVSEAERHEVSALIPVLASRVPPRVKAAIVQAAQLHSHTWRPLRPVWLCPQSFPTAPALGIGASIIDTDARDARDATSGEGRDNDVAWDEVPPLFDSSDPCVKRLAGCSCPPASLLTPPTCSAQVHTCSSAVCLSACFVETAT